MTYICYAVVESRGGKWRGRVNWYISDNKNTVSWLKNRYSKHPMVQFLLRMLWLSEVAEGYESYSG